VLEKHTSVIIKEACGFDKKTSKGDKENEENFFCFIVLSMFKLKI